MWIFTWKNPRLDFSGTLVKVRLSVDCFLFPLLPFFFLFPETWFRVWLITRLHFKVSTSINLITNTLKAFTSTWKIFWIIILVEGRGREGTKPHEFQRLIEFSKLLPSLPSLPGWDILKFLNLMLIGILTLLNFTERMFLVKQAKRLDN